MIEGWRLNMQTSGFFSLWKGLGPTLWRDVPFSGIYWMFYDYLSNTRPDSDSLSKQFMWSFSSGASAGAIAGTLVTPFDVAKTRRQMIIFAKDSDGSMKCEAQRSKGHCT